MISTNVPLSSLACRNFCSYSKRLSGIVLSYLFSTEATLSLSDDVH